MSEAVIAKADEIMLRMGFPRDVNSRYVKELRESICYQVSEHDLCGFGVSWADDLTPLEDRARAILESQWAIERGHSCEREVLDCYPINRRYNAATGRWRYEFRPDRIMPWLRDKRRAAGMHLRIWRDHLLRRRNPYSHDPNI